ncbi:rRNA maturation RNase YbeY [Candidatus Woesebacteria bacterium]|nr:rRNA maturation RNase YbeY [Candidatus Woesebacteria bacterium]
MIKINVLKQSNYPVSATVIKRRLTQFLKSMGIVSDSEVSVAIVGEAKMLEVGKKYLNDGSIHNVLSFTEDELKQGFMYPPDGLVRLGEIIVCFPVAVSEAKIESKLIEDKVYELIEHGALHLLGIHHE